MLSPTIKLLRIIQAIGARYEYDMAGDRLRIDCAHRSMPNYVSSYLLITIDEPDLQNDCPESADAAVLVGWYSKDGEPLQTFCGLRLCDVPAFMDGHGFKAVR